MRHDIQIASVKLQPKNGKGIYFVVSFLAWRPLWRYICSTCEGFLTDDDCEIGLYNEGHAITAKKTIRIAKKLSQSLENGETTRWEVKTKKCYHNLPDEECTSCKGTGTTDDEYGKGICKSCDGKGGVRPYSPYYPFSTDMVKEFNEFCKNSGGFCIW